MRRDGEQDGNIFKGCVTGLPIALLFWAMVWALIELVMMILRALRIAA